MISANKIVEINTQTQSKTLKVKGFGNSCFLGSFKAKADEILAFEFTSLDDVVLQYGVETSPYKHAQVYFGAFNKTPEKFVVIDFGSNKTTIDAFNFAKQNVDNFYIFLLDGQKTKEVIENLSVALEADKGTHILLATQNSKTYAHSTPFTKLAVFYSQENYLATAVASFLGGIDLTQRGASSSIFSKTPRLVLPSLLNDLEGETLKTNKVNFFTDIGGLNWIANGDMANGTSIELKQSIDFIRESLKVSVLNLFSQIKTKLPYDITGEGLIKSVLITKCIEFFNSGIISKGEAFIDGETQILEKGFSVVVPSLEKASKEERDSHIVKGIFVYIRTSGEVRKLTINLEEK